MIGDKDRPQKVWKNTQYTFCIDSQWCPRLDQKNLKIGNMKHSKQISNRVNRGIFLRYKKIKQLLWTKQWKVYIHEIVIIQKMLKQNQKILCE